MTVDYERAKFSVSQSFFQDNLPANLITIPSINATTGANITKITPPPPPTKKISSGAMAGVIIAAIVLCLFIAGLIFFFIRKRRSKALASENPDVSDKAEMDGTGQPAMGELYDEHGDKIPGTEMDGSGVLTTIGDTRKGVEMEGSRAGAEMEGDRPAVEMHGSSGGHEMEGSQGATEMPTPPVEIFELPAQDPKKGVSRAERERRQAAARR